MKTHESAKALLLDEPPGLHYLLSYLLDAKGIKYTDGTVRAALDAIFDRST